MTHPVSKRTYAITLFLILLVCYGYFMPKWADWGANSRADLVYAIGDKGALNIDDYHTNTGDKACFPGPFTADPNNLTGGSCEGHFFTDKSIGPSLLALPFYMVFKAVASIPPIQNFIQSGRGLGALGDTLNPEGQGLRPNALYEAMALTFVTFFASSVPSALLGVIVFLMACRFTSQPVHAFVVALIYGVGTIAFPYSGVLYQHQLAAFGLFVSFYLLWRVIYETANLRWLWAVGVLFSFAIITEYPVVPALGILFLWAAYKMPNRLALYRVILAAIPLGLLFAAYNYAIFQTPMPVGYEYSTAWQDVHSVGFLSLTIPNPATLFGLTFSPFRGIFVLSPALLLCIPGVFILWRSARPYRSGLIAALLVVVFFFVYNSSSAMWWGGFTIGPRYLIPMLPFAALFMIGAVDRYAPTLTGRVGIGLLAALSVANVWIQTISGQSFPPVTSPDMMNNPLFSYSLPLFQQGNIARNYGIIAGLPGLLSLIPLIVALALISWIVPRWLERREQSSSAPSVQQPTTGGLR
jgi:hypothetical protein